MKIPDPILNRTGARNTASVPDDVRKLLNEGEIQSVNLCEWLVVDQIALAGVVFKRLGWKEHLPALRKHFEKTAPTTVPKKIATIGGFLSGIFTNSVDVERAAAALITEASDSARAWAPYMIGGSKRLSLEEKFRMIRPFAADAQMAVPEIAWLALREDFIENQTGAFKILRPFTTDPDDRIRRFASELTRPRGVWCRHVQALKDDPAPGISLLEPLKSDPSNYVRLSVGNWLNDASKSAPALVRETCARWEKESPTPETARIVKRAMRTLAKSG